VDSFAGRAGSELLERESEMAELSALLDAAHAGTGRVALVEGPPGIGKSALLESCKRLAPKRGMRVLAARGGALERDFSFGVVRQLFEPFVTADALVERGALFEGAAGIAAELLGAQPPAGAQPPSGELFALLHGLHWLTAGIAADGPLLIALDDAHWADVPSLRFVQYLARRLEELPVLLVLTARSTESGAPLELIDAIAGEPVASTIRPGPLSATAAGDVLRELFATEPDAEFVRASHEASRGNPFLLTELARALAADGGAPDSAASASIRDVRPEAITRKALVRLGHLAVADQRVARAVATLGDDAALRHVAALADLDEDESADAVDRLAAAGFLNLGRPLRFTHPLMRAVIYDDLGPAQRARLHGRAAALLAGEPARPERVAAHLLSTEPGGDGEVVHWLWRAASEAQRQGAAETAVGYLRRALAEPPAEAEQAAILLDLGRAESAAALPEAADHLLQAFALATDPAMRGDVAEAAGPFLLSAGRTTEMLELLDTVIGELAGQDPERALQLESQYVAAAMLDPAAVHHAVARFERVGESLAGDSTGERMMLCQIAYHAMWRSQDAARAAALARRALGDGRLIADRGVVPFELVGPALALICADELDDVGAMLDEAATSARRHGSEHAYSWVCSTRGTVASRRGAVGEAVSEMRVSLEATLRSGLLLASAVNSAVLVALLLETGELDEAQACLEEIGLDRAFIPPPAPFTLLLGTRGRLRLAQGDTDAGIADLEECGRRSTAFGAMNPLLYPWRIALALALRERGEVEAARALAQEELAMARAWGTPGAIGSAERLVALLSDSDAMIAGLGRAAELLATSPARLEHARALADLGAAQRRANRRSEARETLREALDLAQRCGATVLAEQARNDLLATGARPRRLQLRGVDSLTASERRIADLAAGGLSNPEIAQSLFVTRKTVETHLGRAYSKLDIRSRKELPAALAAVD
jgi:ATP/maltotriose-dependent transcriptional regulator MalT